MIDKFFDEYRFLSNFYPAQVSLEDGKWQYKSVEHAYVAAKTTSEIMRFEVSGIPTAGEAKKFGKTLVIRPDWNEVRLGIMENLVRQKFSDPELREKLFATDPHELVEGNNWHDNFWGSCVCTNCGNKGENNLGKILMQIREEIRQPSLFPIDLKASIV